MALLEKNQLVPKLLDAHSEKDDTMVLEDY